LNDLTAYLKKDKLFGKLEDFPTCHSNRTTTTDPDSAYMFLPAFTGNLMFDQKLSFEGNCFENI
jgi:hypothetical protein